MKFIFLFIFPTLLFAAGDKVNNGEGAAEKNIIFTYSKLESYIKICFQTDACKLNKRQYEILSRILNGLPQERLNKKQIQFVSEKETPGFFIINGELKIAKTDSIIGSSIYINKDLIKDTFSIEQSMMLLIHELGHHYGDYTHTELDILGAKIAAVVQTNIYSTPQLPWNQSVYAVAINSKGSPADFLIYVFNEIIDLSNSLREQASCEASYKESFIYNLHWIKQPQKNPENGIYTIGLNFQHGCVDSEKLKIQFEVKNGAYKAGSLYINY